MCEPVIIAFCCYHCSYEAADRAGGARKEYPENVRIIRVPCTGRIEPEFIMKAFKCGADGVLVLGCRPGGCHFKVGNYKAYGRYLLLRKILKSVGVEEERIKFDWVDASEDDRFVRILTEFVEKIRGLKKL
ncbi:hydrogenase iron-sulfur subunit [Archaeoglobus veneficus]|uniref:Methyl-viologen-reducing hydrogenase delta subunit n=1 Tax=Archaeoglobus veneficus (strain DSM 11195 / SNP6) TaxID=693661 RepID=F2KQC6_ARCVS|nr:hydrogenase iron-sulfur subunit [Archaeoglobus veneficus]AEA46559.1 methyl-viologen-reducing hydrogenase delta subunit [Archaeoglobus veneficus SNP6]